MVRLSVLMPCLDPGHHLAPALDALPGQLADDRRRRAIGASGRYQQLVKEVLARWSA